MMITQEMFDELEAALEEKKSFMQQAKEVGAHSIYEGNRKTCLALLTAIGVMRSRASAKGQRHLLRSVTRHEADGLATS